MNFGYSYYKVVLVLLTTLVGCGNMFDKNKTKFEWLATESAPSEYPMKILEGTLYYHNEKGGLYIPTAVSINSGWGTMVSSHVVGEDFKPLPDRLDIRFFSFTENKFYHGSFDLPYEKILALFKEGVARDKEHPIFNRIMVGVAPGGAVAVWVMGTEYREVFFGQAESFEPENYLFDGVFADREKYVRLELEDSLSPEVLAKIRKEGVPIGKWAAYRKPYHWVPTFVKAQRPTHVNVSLFNGESYKILFPIDPKLAEEPRPVPITFSFAYLMDGEKSPDVFRIRFEEEEIYAVFERLGTNQRKVHIEIDPKLPKEATKIRMYNDKESVELKKYIIRK